MPSFHSGVEVGDAVQRAARRRRLEFVRSSYRAIPFGESEAECYGVLCAITRERGRSTRGRALDLQIAATAGALNVPLLTRNLADLEGLDRVVQVVGV